MWELPHSLLSFVLAGCKCKRRRSRALAATMIVDKVMAIEPALKRELLNLARSRVTRNFTPDECKRYFQSETCPPLP
jgi:hypothetical protein